MHFLDEFFTFGKMATDPVNYGENAESLVSTRRPQKSYKTSTTYRSNAVFRMFQKNVKSTVLLPILGTSSSGALIQPVTYQPAHRCGASSRGLVKQDFGRDETFEIVQTPVWPGKSAGHDLLQADLPKLGKVSPSHDTRHAIGKSRQLH